MAWQQVTQIDCHVEPESGLRTCLKQNKNTQPCVIPAKAGIQILCVFVYTNNLVKGGLIIMNDAKKQLLNYISDARDSEYFTEEAHYILLNVIDGCNTEVSLTEIELRFVTERANAIATAIKRLKLEQRNFKSQMASIALATYINTCGK